MTAEGMLLSDFVAAAEKLGATKILFKILAANDNSKNQIYFGSSFDILQMLPLGSIEPDPMKPDRLKAALKLSWLTADGHVAPAPNAQLILYPQYPEVRFSGFLRGAPTAPSELLRADARIPGRVLALALAADQAYAATFSPDSAIAHELETRSLPYVSVFKLLEVSDSRTVLLQRLAAIHAKGWILSELLHADGSITPCKGTNCGGFTLEAELGISPNSRAAPDFLGWEVKAHSAAGASRVTLMTPEPTGGMYHAAGAAAFVRRFGHGTETSNRLDFSGTFRNNVRQNAGLTLTLKGFDHLTRRFDPQGAVELVTDHGEVAASWSFSALMNHWTRKHDRASYVPYEKRELARSSFRYGPTVRLGVQTDFTRLLRAMYDGLVIYDPGLNIKNAFEGRPVVKMRSQFRIPLGGLDRLYERFETLDLSARGMKRG